MLIGKVHPPQFGWITEDVVAPNEFLFDIINRGRTVARLMDFRGIAHFMPVTKQLPEFPDYENLIFYNRGPINGKVLAPGDAQEGIPFSINDMANAAKRNQVENGDLLLHFYAFVKYFDFDKNERRLQFCYRFVPKSAIAPEAKWVIAGPPAYNIHT